MAPHWGAVARTIEEHITRLGLDQARLAERSGVSVTTVRELRTNSVQRRRDGRTLQALSAALELHPRHLSAVAAGHLPPLRDHPAGETDRLTRVERRLNDIAARVDAINSRVTQVIDLARRSNPPRSSSPLTPGS